MVTTNAKAIQSPTQSELAIKIEHLNACMIQQPFALPTHFSPATTPTLETNTASATNRPSTWWFICDGSNLLTTLDESDAIESEVAAAEVAVTEVAVTEVNTCTLPQAHSLSDLGMSALRTQFLGYLNGHPCISAELKNASEHPETLAFQNLRSLYGTLPEDLFAIAARAVQITEWDRTHQYCGHCATPMTQNPTERAKRCPTCKLRQYPRLSPAVIMLISKGDQLLLARAPRFRNGMYSVLAGFVEPGESLEETVAREVREEVGIEIKNIRYFGSQPWPFPDSLMVGFTAEYASGEITPDPTEIEAADWFDKGKLPPVPGKLSIARKLIDTFVAS